MQRDLPPLPSAGQGSLQPFLAGRWGDEQELTFPEHRGNVEPERISAPKEFPRHFVQRN